MCSFTFPRFARFCSTLRLPAGVCKHQKYLDRLTRVQQVRETCWRVTQTWRFLILLCSTWSLSVLPSLSLSNYTHSQLHLAPLLMPDWLNQSPEVSCPEAVGASLTPGQSRWGDLRGEDNGRVKHNLTGSLQERQVR